MAGRKVTIMSNYVEKAKELIGSFANHSHYTRTFEDDVEVVLTETHPNSGSDLWEVRLIGRLIPGALSTEAVQSAHAHIRTITTPVTNRFAVAGKGSAVPRICKDGTVSATTEVPKSVQAITGYSDVIGYLAPTPRCRRGRLSGWTRTHRKARAALEPILREIDDVFAREYRNEHDYQATGWTGNGVYNFYGGMDDETAFSSCYGNANVRSAYHRDGHNLNGSLSAVFTMGEYEGGGLVLPQYGVSFNLQPCDLLLFYGDDVHGVTPFTGQRYSGVFFSAAQYQDFWQEVGLPTPDPNDPVDL